MSIYNDPSKEKTELRFHLSVPIEAALGHLKAGRDIFDLPIPEAQAELLRMKKEGKTFFTSDNCDSIDERGACKGHKPE